MNAAGILFDTARRLPDKAALIFNGREYSYRDLAARANRLANGLAGIGIRPGDHVGVAIPNSPEFVISYFGVIGMGAVLVPLTPTYRGDELQRAINNTDLRAVLAADEPLARIRGICSELRTLEQLIHVELESSALTPAPFPPRERGEVASYRDLMEAASPEAMIVERGPDDLAVIAFTGGTTGTFKGAMLSHAFKMESTRFRSWQHQLTQEDRVLSAMPLFHAHGEHNHLRPTIHLGGTLVLMERFDAEQALANIERYRCTFFSGASTMYVRFINLPDTARFDLSSLRHCYSSAAAISPETKRAFEERYGVTLIEGYGVTECSAVIAFTPPDRPRKHGSVGVVPPGRQLRIVSDEGEALPSGRPGEVAFKDLYPMKGYYRMPEASSEALRDGWYYTGDLGRMDEDGYLFLLGRKKDLINRGGDKISPKEVEEALFRHPSVAEAAVIGVPSAEYGEEVKAFVVLRDGAMTSADELRRHCRGQLAPFKVPKAVEFLAALPKGPAGKVLHRELRAREVGKA